MNLALGGVCLAFAIAKGWLVIDEYLERRRAGVHNV